MKVAHGVDALVEGSTQDDALAEIFEQRMEIEAADSEEELFAIQMDVQTQYNDRIKEMGDSFEKEDFEGVKKLLERSKYLD